MTQHQISTTLDAERTIQLRAFLTDEANHSAAPTLARTRNGSRSATTTGRRLAVGVGVAALIGGGIFGVTAVTGGPGPAAVSDAVAIEITDGWTTVAVTDPDADPDSVLAQLEAAGVPAQIEELRADETGLTTIQVAVGSVGSINPAAAGAGGLISLSVSSPALTQIFGADGEGASISFERSDPDASQAAAPAGTASGDPAAKAAMDQFREKTALAYEEAGVRLDDDGSVSIRSGSGAHVVIYATR